MEVAEVLPWPCDPRLLLEDLFISCDAFRGLPLGVMGRCFVDVDHVSSRQPGPGDGREDASRLGRRLRPEGLDVALDLRVPGSGFEVLLQLLARRFAVID